MADSLVKVYAGSRHYDQCLSVDSALTFWLCTYMRISLNKHFDKKPGADELPRMVAGPSRGGARNTILSSATLQLLVT